MAQNSNGFPEKRFLGTKTREQAKTCVAVGEFGFFYSLPDLSGNFEVIADLPYHVHLECVYRTTFGEYHFFPMSRSKWGWKVDVGDLSVAGFSSLTQLIRYHEIYSYLCVETRAIETFPVFPNVQGQPSNSESSTQFEL